MKEKIYTIPINEAYDEDCECPFCEIERRLEQQAIEYELGPAMMEPDHRELSNEKGFCRHHYKMLFEMPNKLSLALVLDTRLEQIRKELDTVDACTKRFFGHNKKEEKRSCIICDKLENTQKRYINTFLQMLADSEFMRKFENSKGFCIPHFEKIYKTCSDKKIKAILLEKEKKELERIQEDIHRFTLKFDYRSKDMEWGSAKDAPIRTVEKITGFIENTVKE